MKSRFSRARWTASEAEISLALSKRIVQTIGGEFPLRHFDGALMMQYQFPTRAAEERFCRGYPKGCSASQGTFSSGGKDHPITSFEVRTSSIGGGRGVFAKEDIAKNDYLALGECVYQMFVPPSSYSILHHSEKVLGLRFWKAVYHGYIDGYGLLDSYFVSILILRLLR